MNEDFLLHKWTLAQLAWRNVFRNWRHSLATLLTIGCGFAAIALFDGFLNDLIQKNYDGYSRRAMLGQAVIMKKGASQVDLADPWNFLLDSKDQAFIDDYLAKDSDIKQRVRFLSISGILNSKDQSSYFGGYGYDLDSGAAVRGKRWEWDALAGRPLEQGGEPSVEIGRGLAKLLGCMPEGPLPLQKSGNYIAEVRPLTCAHARLALTTTTETAQINLIDFPISSVIDAGSMEADKRAVQMSLADAQRLLNTKKISQVSVDLDPSKTEQFIENFESAAEAAGYQFEVLRWWEHPLAANARGGIQILGVFRNLFMAIVAAIGAMAIANSMMKSVNERFREIATLRSIGFYRQDMLWLFGFEGLLTSLSACLAGLGLTLVLGKIIGSLGISFDAGFLSLPIFLQIANSPKTWLICAGLLTLLAVLTSLLCVRRASAMKIADALRYV